MVVVRMAVLASLCIFGYPAHAALYGEVSEYIFRHQVHPVVPKLSRLKGEKNYFIDPGMKLCSAAEYSIKSRNPNMLSYNDGVRVHDVVALPGRNGFTVKHVLRQFNPINGEVWLDILVRATAVPAGTLCPGEQPPRAATPILIVPGN